MGATTSTGQQLRRVKGEPYDTIGVDMSLAKEDDGTFTDAELKSLMDSFIAWVEGQGLYCGGGFKGEHEP